MSFSSNSIPLEDINSYRPKATSWQQDAIVAQEPEYILVRVPVINGVPQFTFIPNGASTTVAANDDPLEHESKPSNPHIRRTVQALPIVIAVFLVIIWAVVFAATIWRENAFIGAMFMAIMAGFASAFAFFQISASFIGGTTLKVAFWMAIPLSVLCLALNITGFVFGDFISSPFGLIVFVLHVAWIITTGIRLKRVCCCEPSENCC
jgi:hypothetical protein